jgi:hypothetical protein
MKTLVIQTKGNGKRSMPISYFSLPILLFSLFTFHFSLSCTTVPKTADFIFEEATVIPLEPGAFAYILTDIRDTKPFLDVQDKNIQQIVDATRYAVAAFYLPHDTRRYHLAAWGNYPSSRAKIALGANKDWKKMTSQANGSEYWYSEKDRLSVALTATQAFVSAGNAGNNTPADPFPSGTGTTIPEGFNEFRRGAVFSCWLENPSTLIGQKLTEMGIPLEIPAEQVFFSISPVTNQTGTAAGRNYESALKIQFTSDTQALAIATILTFARGLFSLRANPPDADQGEGISDIFTLLTSVLFANPPLQEGKSLIIKTNALDSENISLLFKSFSLW